MSNKEKWADLFETVNGRKPTPQEFMDAKAKDFDASDLEAAVKTQEVAAEEVSAEAEVQGVGIGETVADQAAIDSVAESAEDAVAEEPHEDSTSQPEQVSEASVSQPVPAAPQASLDTANNGLGAQVTHSGRPDNQLFNLILPIVALVLGVISAILAWVLPAWIFILLTFVSVGLAVASLIMSLKSNKKLLSIIATAVTGFMVFVAIGGLIFQIASSTTVGSSQVSQISDDDDDDTSSDSDVKGDSNNVNDYIDKNASFDWDEKKFQKLKVEEDTVKSIIKTYGKASDAQMSGDSLTLRYEGNDYSQHVSLSFEKQYDGTFVLSSAMGSFSQDYVEVDRDYKSDWTQEQYDALKEGDYKDATSGTKLDDVLKDHPKAESATFSINSFRKGEFSKSLHVTYSDYNQESGKLDYVSLSFEYVDKEDAFYLDSKYGADKD